MTLDPSCNILLLINDDVMRSGPTAQISIVFISSSKSKVSNFSTSVLKYPALLIKISIGLPSLTTLAYNCFVSSVSVASIPVIICLGCNASNSGEEDRTIAINSAPALVTSVAKANPNPRFAPVIATRLPFKYDGS